MNNDLEQFSEERLKQLASGKYAGTGLGIQNREVAPLARIALAAKQAKPVGWMDTCELFDLQHGYTSKILPKKEMNNDIPLYTTTPPPHTEQGNQVEVHQFIINNPEKDGYIEWADCNKDYFDSISIDHRRVLYTTPQPAHTEQDGWINCSERMPDDGQIVAIINAGHGEIYEAATVTRSGPHFILMDGLEASNYDGGAVVTLSMEATHWMPLPATPKPESE